VRGISPRVSVVVTCFDLGSTLEEALASVEAQTLRDFEIVVVDDGSRDPETLAVLGRISEQRARVLRTENWGSRPRATMACASYREVQSSLTRERRVFEDRTVVA
jgi:glycosyltransferase involved in cell wall biosynthesis